ACNRSQRQQRSGQEPQPNPRQGRSVRDRLSAAAPARGWRDARSTCRNSYPSAVPGPAARNDVARIAIRKLPRSADFWYPVFFFLFTVTACWKLNPLRAPILQDDQVYYFISERAASGIAPHLSEFDPKNALSMMVTAVFIWI